MNDIIFYFAIKYQNNYQLVYQALLNHEKVDEDLLKEYLKQDLKYITILDELYPIRLKQLKYPPFVLFYEGDISLLNQELTVVIGQKKAHYPSINHTIKFCQAIHQPVLTYECVGINYNVIKSTKNDLVVLTKNKLGQLNIYETGKLDQFEKRIIIGLASKIVLVEADMSYDDIDLINEAIELNRDLYCMPALFNYKSWCNELIKSGAYLCDQVEDLK